MTVPECVIDTDVLQKANAPILSPPGPMFRRRVALLARIRNGQLVVLMSARVLAEYGQKVREPRNDYVKLFLELASDPRRARMNWVRHWSGKYRSYVSKCRFPHHDLHLLRTAVRPNGATIYTEEGPLLRTDQCIHRYLRVHVAEPPQ